MNMSFKCEIDPSQCIRLLLLVMVVPSSQLWMEKEIIEGKVPIDSEAGAFHGELGKCFRMSCDTDRLCQ